MLDELHAKGELLKGHFVDDAAGADANGSDDSASERSPRQTPQQWLHKDVFRRIRALSLAKARKAIKPVEPAVYQAFLLDRQGVGPVGGARYEGVDGLMRVIEQLEGIYLNASVWESSVFPHAFATTNRVCWTNCSHPETWYGSAPKSMVPTPRKPAASHSIQLIHGCW